MTANFAKTVLRSCMKNLNVPRSRFSSSYKAAIIKEANLEIIETKPKKLQKDEVRIQVHYCSVNSTDCLTFRDKSKSLIVPGYELSGEVTEIHKSVTPEQLIVGEKVAALSLEKFGGFADECVVKKTTLLVIDR